MNIHIILPSRRNFSSQSIAASEPVVDSAAVRVCLPVSVPMRARLRVAVPGFFFVFALVLGLIGAGANRGLAAPVEAGLDLIPDVKSVTVPLIEAKIKIDGQLDEWPWRKAPRLTPFVQHDTRQAEREKTEVRIWYDHEALYLGWICEDRDIQATLRKRDSKFWEEEVVEFFVAPNPKVIGRYYELQWNPLGGTFDATIQNKLGASGRSERFDGDWSFTATNMTYALQVDGSVQDSSDRDERWVVEVRIPFSDLKVRTPRRGEVWRGNFYRFNRENGREPELLSWSPTIWPGFHQPTRFGVLRFGGGD